ncbi:LysR family transcriptional regulator [Halomonas sp. I1]|uniref:LysR family transcriptional regulator n=1 Tax=Halomonas sp. I1 TaxID=393536 RepID=UPI0028DE7D44|nr:LysR family transcriptional regulator [Halomonas sp. I1]MDT8893109.1 LysR family transcriptional regulator [Halomonas sp. I1]
MSILSKEVMAFFVIAKTESVRLAAENLHISPSALSRQIRILEEQLGQRLFLRQSRGVTLTVHGRYFLQKITDIIQQESEIVKHIGNLGEGKPRRISMGIMECLSTEGFGRMLYDLGQETRDFLDIRVGTTDELVEKLLKQEVDFIVAFNTPRDSRIRFVHEFPCAIGLVCHPGHPLARSHSTTLERALEEDIVLADSSLSIYSRVEYEIMRRRKSASITLRTNSISLLKRVVAGGESITLLSRLDILDEQARGELVFVPFSNSRMSESLEIAVHQDAALEAVSRDTIARIDERLTRLTGSTQ